MTRMILRTAALLIAVAGMTVALNAQTPTTPAASGPPSAAKAEKTPPELTKRLTELLQAGKIADARLFVEGLMVVYPNDERLTKAATMMDNIGSPAPEDAKSAPSPAAPTGEASLTGMENVEYNSLIELAKEAQQTNDTANQRKLLRQFMDDSSKFLGKRPEMMLLWQLRAVSALSLDEPRAGYEAGQKLLAAGAAESRDEKIQALMIQLRSKGWLDRSEVDHQQQGANLRNEFDWIVGTWKAAWRWDIKREYDADHDHNEEIFVINGTTVEGYAIESGVKQTQPNLRGQIVEDMPVHSIKWECYLPPSDPGGMFVYRHHWPLGSRSFFTIGTQLDGDWERNRTYYPSGWVPVLSTAGGRNVLIITIPSQNQHENSDEHTKHPVALTFKKNSSSLIIQ